MAKLYLKGIRTPITVTTSQAINIGKAYEDDSVSDKLKMNVNGTRFLKEDIKNIIENDIDDTRAEVSDNKRTENDSYYADVSKDYNKYILRLCDKPIEEKANDTKLYQLAWSGFTLSPITQEFLDEVKLRQKAFYEVNPKYPYASINISDLLPRKREEEDSINELMPSYISKRILLIVDEAFRTAKALHKI